MKMVWYVLNVGICIKVYKIILHIVIKNHTNIYKTEPSKVVCSNLK